MIKASKEVAVKAIDQMSDSKAVVAVVDTTKELVNKITEVSREYQDKFENVSSNLANLRVDYAELLKDKEALEEATPKLLCGRYGERSVLRSLSDPILKKIVEEELVDEVTELKASVRYREEEVRMSEANHSVAVRKLEESYEDKLNASKRSYKKLQDSLDDKVNIEKVKLETYARQTTASLMEVFEPIAKLISTIKNTWLSKLPFVKRALRSFDDFKSIKGSIGWIANFGA